jgi:predicted CoA-binding protein
MEPKTQCELPDGNPPGEEITKLLTNARTVAVVGLSDRPDRDSFRVAAYLKDKGYRIIPVNPNKSEILGEQSYPDLASVPEKIDIVDIFRQVEAIPAIVDEAIRIRAGAVWMQLGLAHNESARKARAAGLVVVQSRCMKIEHEKLFGQ